MLSKVEMLGLPWQNDGEERNSRHAGMDMQIWLADGEMNIFYEKTQRTNNLLRAQGMCWVEKHQYHQTIYSLCSVGQK